MAPNAILARQVFINLFPKNKVILLLGGSSMAACGDDEEDISVFDFGIDLGKNLASRGGTSAIINNKDDALTGIDKMVKRVLAKRLG